MIERFLFTVLQEGVAAAKADPRILEDLFATQYSLSTTEVAAIKQVFEKTPPTVVHGYARAETQFPAYSITLGNEGEREHFIGDDAGMISDAEDPDFGSEIFSSIWEHSYNIMCYAEHPDVTRYIYEVAKSALLANVTLFQTEGIFQVEFSGMDLAPDPRYIPEHLFVRQLQFRCRREFQRLDRGLEKAFKVAGIHIDKSGSPSDVGGVKTLVTVSGGEDGEE